MSFTELRHLYLDRTLRLSLSNVHSLSTNLRPVSSSVDKFCGLFMGVNTEGAQDRRRTEASVIKHVYISAFLPSHPGSV